MQEVVDIKKGYVKIANNLFENIFIRDFTKRELELILLIIRLSYGFNRKRAIIEPKARICLIGIQAPNIDRTLDRLLDKKVILSHGNNIYSLNKHYDQWQIRINKYFSEEKFANLKALQFKKDVITEITKNDDNYYQADNENIIPPITSSNQEDNNNYYQADNMDIIPQITPSNQEDNNDIITTITPILSPREQKTANYYQGDNTTIITPIIKNEKTLSPREYQEGGNAETTDNTDPCKDIFKDMLNTSLNTCIKGNDDTNSSKKFDPYFNNPVVEKFKSLYEKNLKVARCYLDNFQIHKLIEISAENPDFLEKLPLIIEKYARIEFSHGINKFGIRGLINEGKWAAILNGEYDKYIKPENENFDLGIPIV